ncbi:MAG: aminotransferase [Candidatus Krumholzibacteriota bacterium]|nr:aminotransferase [Candidatus Krumholzibacteriota bacterium]
MKPMKLFTPGPTVVPWRVREKMARPIIHHRTSEYRAIQRGVTDDLRRFMKTENPVLLLASSGTGAMEAALANVTRPGEKVLVTAMGKFSARWKEIAEVYGLEVVSADARWGDPVSPEAVERALDENPGVRAVFTTHAETSTGVLQDVRSVAKIARERGALIVVDAITTICAENLETDLWGLDVVVGSSQKGVMTPPGLAFVSISPAARERVEGAGRRAYYFDLNRALAAYDNGDTPWTPPIGLVMGLGEALKMIGEEGLENVIERHGRNARATRRAVEALGLELLASSPANCTTAVVFKDGNAETVRKHLFDVHGIRIAGGQAELKGKIVRLGHLGYCFESDIFTLISGLESTLLDIGVIEASGKGIEALFREFHEM